MICTLGKIILALTVILIGVGFFAEAVLAETFNLEYPDFVNPEVTKTPAEFINNLYIYALGISGTLAVMMIVYGGVKYAINPGNTSAQGDATDIIKNAVFGVVLLAGAYLILETVNPSLVILKNPALEPVPTSTSETLPPTISTFNTSLLHHDDGTSILNRFGIAYESSGNCGDPDNSSCTSFEGFPKAAMCKLIEMKYRGASDIKITAGTETGHLTHGSGKPVVDLHYSKFSGETDNFIAGEVGYSGYTILQSYLDKKLPGRSGSVYMLETKDGKPDHWHVTLQIKNLVGSVRVSGLEVDDSRWSACKYK